MPMLTRLNKARLQEIIAKTPRAVAGAVAATAFDVQSDAAQAAPVDTGALRNSIAAQAQSPFVWWVVVGVLYGKFVEFGTSRTRAQPFLTPAVEHHRATFVERIRSLFR